MENNTVWVNNVEVMRVGRLAVRVSWLAPYIAVMFPNWTDEEEAAATELPCYHAETLEDALRVAGGVSKWVSRLAKCERDASGGVRFRYDALNEEVN